MHVCQGQGYLQHKRCPPYLTRSLQTQLQYTVSIYCLIRPILHVLYPHSPCQVVNNLLHSNIYINIYIYIIHSSNIRYIIYYIYNSNLLHSNIYINIYIYIIHSSNIRYIIYYIYNSNLLHSNIYINIYIYIIHSSNIIYIIYNLLHSNILTYIYINI